MEEKHGCLLVETNRDNSNLLPVECVFEGEVEFPTGGIGHFGWVDDHREEIDLRTVQEDAWVETLRQNNPSRLNAGSVPSLINTIAEYYDSSGKPSPQPGYRLTETVSEDRDSFRDSGWKHNRRKRKLPQKL
jgi:hypothetical protein